MNFCTQCGNQLKSDSKFCTQCGQLVAAEVKPAPVVTPQKNLCSKCGTVLAPGIKFCTVCGTPAASASATASTAARPGVVNPLPFQAPPPPGASAQPRIQVPPPPAQPPKKKKGRKILVFAVSAVVLLTVAIAALYFLGTYEPKETFGSEGTFADLSGLYEDEKYDQVKIDSAATAVEAIFLDADTAKLAQILSPTSLEQKREFFGELQPHMAAYGNDFKTRKFLYATARFAVYEFSSAEGTFTAEFCLGEDGKWKLMRF